MTVPTLNRQMTGERETDAEADKSSAPWSETQRTSGFTLQD